MAAPNDAAGVGPCSLVQGEVATGAPQQPAADTGRHSPAELHDRISRLHDGLARAHQDLAKQARIRLAVSGESSDITDVKNASPFPAKMLTAQDLSKLLQVDAKTVRRWRNDGHLPPALEIGGVIRWSVKTVEDWIQEMIG